MGCHKDHKHQWKRGLQKSGNDNNKNTLFPSLETHLFIGKHYDDKILKYLSDWQVSCVKWIPTTQFQVAQTGEDKILRYSYFERKLSKAFHSIDCYQIVETSGFDKKMRLCGGVLFTWAQKVGFSECYWVLFSGLATPTIIRSNKWNFIWTSDGNNFNAKIINIKIINVKIINIYNKF